MDKNEGLVQAGRGGPDSTQSDQRTYQAPIAEAEAGTVNGNRRPFDLLRKLNDRGQMFIRLWLRAISGRLDRQEALLLELEGKSVSVVGNARTLAFQEYGSEIEKNDIVIRFNRAPIPAHSSHGHRTDWLATAVPLDISFIEELKCSRVLWMSRRRRKMKASMVRDLRLYLHPSRDIANLAARAGVERPSCGLSILDLLVRSACIRVDLFGFDFYESRSLSGKQTVESTPHDFAKEKAFVAGILARDTRFTICG